MATVNPNLKRKPAQDDEEFLASERDPEVTATPNPDAVSPVTRAFIESLEGKIPLIKAPKLSVTDAAKGLRSRVKNAGAPFPKTAGETPTLEEWFNSGNAGGKYPETEEQATARQLLENPQSIPKIMGKGMDFEGPPYTPPAKKEVVPVAPMVEPQPKAEKPASQAEKTQAIMDTANQEKNEYTLPKGFEDLMSRPAPDANGSIIRKALVALVPTVLGGILGGKEGVGIGAAHGGAAVDLLNQQENAKELKAQALKDELQKTFFTQSLELQKLPIQENLRHNLQMAYALTLQGAKASDVMKHLEAQKGLDAVLMDKKYRNIIENELKKAEVKNQQAQDLQRAKQAQEDKMLGAKNAESEKLLGMKGAQAKELLALKQAQLKNKPVSQPIAEKIGNLMDSLEGSIELEKLGHTFKGGIPENLWDRVKETFGAQNPQRAKERADIINQELKITHGLFGARQTPQEISRAQQGMPSAWQQPNVFRGRSQSNTDQRLMEVENAIKALEQSGADAQGLRNQLESFKSKLGEVRGASPQQGPSTGPEPHLVDVPGRGKVPFRWDDSTKKWIEVQ